MSADFAVERIIWLHKRIKEGYYPNAMRLSERFGISHRQAQRDADYLRRKIGAPIAFCPTKKGYYYTEEFSLPDSIRVEDPQDYAGIIAVADRSFAGDDGSMQLSIPYTAILEIPDKLVALELGPFVTRKLGKSNKYFCEFHNIRVFFGALVAADAEIKIIEPLWLRNQFKDSINKLLVCNNDEEE